MITINMRSAVVSCILVAGFPVTGMDDSVMPGGFNNPQRHAAHPSHPSGSQHPRNNHLQRERVGNPAISNEPRPEPFRCAHDSPDSKSDSFHSADDFMNKMLVPHEKTLHESYIVSGPSQFHEYRQCTPAYPLADGSAENPTSLAAFNSLYNRLIAMHKAQFQRPEGTLEQQRFEAFRKSVYISKNKTPTWDNMQDWDMELREPTPEQTEYMCWVVLGLDFLMHSNNPVEERYLKLKELRNRLSDIKHYGIEYSALQNKTPRRQGESNVRVETLVDEVDKVVEAKLKTMPVPKGSRPPASDIPRGKRVRQKVKSWLPGRS